MRRLWILLLLAVVPARAGEDDLKRRVEQECAKLQQVIEEFLGPKFPGPVPVRMVDKEFILQFARDLEERLAPSGLMEAAQRLMVRLRQIPEGYDVTEKMLEMLGRSVAGLYDPEQDCFYVVRTAGSPGSGPFAITAAHELVHAYRDVDKDYWARVLASAYTDEDWAIAVTCLVEGDAQLLGTAIGAASFNGQPVETFLEHQVGNARVIGRQMHAALAGALGEFPLAMREMFATRYVIGQTFAAELYRTAGTRGLDAAYDRPPRSTEQVLHPAKYLERPADEPTVFRGGDPTAALGEGWSLTIANVFGEFALRVHFTKRLGAERAEKAADGWDGARYFFCEKSGVPSFVGMISTWDSEEDARDFAAAWVEWAARRDRGEHAVERTGARARVETAEGLVLVERRGRDVLVADGVPADRVEAVLKALAAAQRSERAPDATPVAPSK